MKQREESEGKVTRERERERSDIWREKIIITKYKIQMNSNHVNVHGYCKYFGYLDNFGLIDVEDFWGKMCKTCFFLYFTKPGVIAY